MTDPIITAARDHAAARRDVLADIAASLPPDQLASAAVDLAVLASEDLARVTAALEASSALNAKIHDALETATADAEAQRTAAADLRAALDRVAKAAGVDTDSTGAIVADRVIAVIRRPALPADLRTYLETRRDRLQGGHGLGLAAEIAAINRWLALPTADATGGGQ